MTTYPVFVPSKGRAARSLTADMFVRDGVEFTMVVEPSEADIYQTRFENVLVLPVDDYGISFARSWIKDHAVKEGHDRHWQFDDNIRNVRAWEGGTRPITNSAEALTKQEQFIDRYTNVAISGMQHSGFGFKIPAPFGVNQMVYSAVLVRSDDYRWRGKYGGEDIDYSLQVLSDGLCTILFRYYQIEKYGSGKLPGGNTEMYETAGRRARIRELQQQWPRIVKERERWDRPTHDLNHVWRTFPQRPVNA